MQEKVLIFCTSKYTKAILLRLVVEMGLDAVDAWDLDDVQLKADLFVDMIVLFIVEVTPVNRSSLYRFIRDMQANLGRVSMPVLALIPNDSSEMVGEALKAGVRDLLLLPSRKELYRSVMQEKLRQVYMDLRRRLTSGAQTSGGQAESDEAVERAAMNETLSRELKLAGRGGHTVSILMVRTSGLTSAQLDTLEQELADMLRDTDQVVRRDPRTFIVICPFTAKSFLVEVERKIHLVYEKLFGTYTQDRRFFMAGANYPDDGREMETLVQLMENGIHDSVVINGIRAPLREMSRAEIEGIRRKLKLYKF